MSLLDQLKAARQQKGLLTRDIDDEAWKSPTQSQSNVLCCGSGRYGRIGRNHEQNQGELLPVFCDAKFDSVAVGAAHLAALSEDKHVYTWGKCHVGQLGHGQLLADAWAPRRVPGLEGASMVKCGLSHVLARCGTEGHIYGWGMGYNYCLGISDEKHRTTPALLSGGIPPVADMDGGRFHSVFVCGNHAQLYICGGKTAKIKTPTAVEIRDIVSVAAGHDDNVVVTADGSIFLVRDLLVKKLTIPEGARAASASIKGGAVLVLTTDGRLLGRGDVPFGYAPFDSGKWSVIDVSGEKEAIAQVSMGHYHAMALTSSNRLYAWGENCFGALGMGPIPNGYNVTRERPVSDGFRGVPSVVDLAPSVVVKQIVCGSSVSALLT